MNQISTTDRNKKRIEYYNLIKNFLMSKEEDVDFCVKGDTSTAILNFPTTINNEDAWVEIMISVPTKADYDGYEQRKAYTSHIIEKETKAKEAQKKKEAKIKRDEEMRRQKAEAKAKRENAE